MRPINSVGFRQAPFERPVTVIGLFHFTRVHFVVDAKAFGSRAASFGGGVDQFVEIRTARSKEIIHRPGPFMFIDHVRVVHILAHLELEEPGQFAVHQRISRIIAQAIVAKQFDPALDPPPPVIGIGEFDGNIEGHVPGLDDPDLSEARFQFRDPVGQLNHFKIFAVLLQVVGPNPKRVGDEATEAAERDRGESQHRRGVGTKPDSECKPQFRIGALPIERLLELRHSHQQSHGAHQQTGFVETSAHSVIRLGSGQFAAGEASNPDGSEDSAEQKHDLSDREGKLAPGNAPARAERINRRKSFHQIHYLQHSAKNGQDDQIDPASTAGAGFVIQTQNTSFRNDRGKSSAG